MSRHENRRAMMSRADLVRAFTAGDEAVRSVSTTLGLSYREEVAQTQLQAIKVTGGFPSLSASATFSQTLPQSTGRVHLWRIDEAGETNPQGVHARVADNRPMAPTVDEVRAYSGRRKPRTQPIVPWSRLRPALADMTAGDAGKGPVDLDKLVERLGQMAQVMTLPRKAALGPTVFHILVDRKRRLVPFWDDQDMVIGWLKKSIGKNQVKVHRCLHKTATPVLGQGERLLALTDLGLFGSLMEQREWQEVGRLLRDKGVRLTALVPCPKQRWDKSTTCIWNALDWSAPGHVGNAAGAPSTAAVRQDQAETLLTLLSASWRIEPGLLREVRQALPKRAADLGTEADAWDHPAIVDRSYAGCWIAPSTAKKWRAKYAALPTVYREAAVNAMRHWHEKREYGLFEAEVVALDRDCRESDALSESEKRDARKTVRGIVSGVPGADSGGDIMARAIGGYFAHLDAWAGDGVLADDELGTELREAKYRSLLPVEPSGKEYQWTVYELSGDFVLQNAADETRFSGRSVATLPARGVKVGVIPKGARELAGTLTPDTQRISIPPNDRIVLFTNVASVTVVRSTPPPWADCYAWDRYGIYAEFEINKARFKLRWIPPGSFQMGSPEDELGRDDDEGPVHRVIIKNGFWLGETPVTQGQYEAVTGKNLSEFKKSGRDAPVEQVDWHQARAFCKTMNARLEGLDDLEKFRLPSEAEWEYACRAGTEGPLYSGKPLTIEEGRCPNLDELAWYDENSEGKTHPVKEKLVNPWGLYDMLGNVWEWCEDPWHGSYEGAPVNGSAWFDDADEGRNRVFRGGGWILNARRCRAACRYGFVPGDRWDVHGFRLVLAHSETGRIPLFEQEERGGGRSDLDATRAEPGEKRTNRKRSGDGE